MASCALRSIFLYKSVARILTPLKESDKMYSKYNRFLFSTCIQILAFSALISLPVRAEFKWTPPDEPEYVEDMGPDVFMVDDESSSMGSGSALPEYYDTPRVENNQAIEISPPIEIKALEKDTEQASEEPIEIKTINLTEKDGTPEPPPEPEPVQNGTIGEPASSPSLILNPYPLENNDLPPAKEEAIEKQAPVPPTPVQESASDINQNKDVTYEVIEGFGIKMPMALALSQIVPPEYAYSFSEGVNPGARLSWEGGKAWNIVLNDALTPLGIEASINGKKVVLRAINALPQKKNDAPKPAKEFKETPEQSISTSLEESYKASEIKAPAESNSIVLDKTTVDVEASGDNDDASALVDNLMRPLDSFENGENVATEPKKSASVEEPTFRPEIVLDAKEKEEEEYAKKLEETNPFGSNAEPIELLPISDTPTTMDNAKEVTNTPTPVPFEEEGLDFGEIEEPAQASDVIDEDLVLSSTEEMDELEPSSHFRDVPSNKIRIWEAKRNSNLQKILAEWSAKERVPLKWDTTEKYTLDYDVFISGTFQNAIDILFKKGLKSAPKYALSEAPYGISVQEDKD